MDEHTADSVVSDTAADNQRLLKRHRARHTKSRNGCYPCKFRRVKCDELQPACGTCSSRGEPCSYPRPCIPLKKPPRPRREETGNNNRSLLPDYFAPSDGGSPLGLIQPLGINATLPALFSSQSNHGHGALAMNDLKLLQFFHLYTAKQMSLHPRRAMAWQQIIPEFGSKNQYLMHLLLALGGIHMITQQAEANRTGGFEDSDTVDLAVIVEHHQRGLKGFREEVSCISPSNAELVFTGSLLLVGFAFASLKIQELNSLTETPEEINSAMENPSSTNDILHLNWLYLNRGVSSVIKDQWHVLKASRLQQMVVFSHGDEFWKDLPFNAPSSRLSHCSPRLFKFAEGASQAVANIRASLNVPEPAKDDLSSCSGTLTSQPSPSMTLDWVVDAQSGAMDVLDTVYSRILSVLRCAATEKPADMEIQLDFEEAAILSWPVLLPSPFLASLERSEHNCLHGHSLVILAHFYLVNTLVDTWFLRGSFESGIFKINALIGTLNESQLSTFMLWPNEVMNLPQTCTP
ncbi:Zn(II)2Cys6 transcription factor domain-containing protein [Aspergillus glaucus CBS 516.65]|uniref:Zn(2)-C6 fungal-type domain-containing protein n=1 Tax=Aspergillus glaucus CBS 516.65 TaxID=1160497 RepID=A0A1L9VYI2_ASPGL|nr:hypothetical protein ASPGLDRAFT_185773 [Aspergillus glaucus CBS 516.65]OJJ88980.1 hypothetical protein ASPGLDRAFT_185773 [Aspergillus glaucus CBS 516.65]